MMIRTGNPYRDAEYAAMEPEREHRVCECCGEPLYIADDMFDGDEAWHIGGKWYCDDCAESMFKEEVY